MKLPLSILIPLSVSVLPACSDAPPQPPAIGLQAALSDPYPEHNPENRKCKVQPNGSRSYVIGKPTASGTVEAGKGGVDELNCTVRKNGSISLELSASNQAVGLPGLFTMNLTGTVVSPTDATQNQGALGFFDAGAGPMGMSGTTPPCTIGPASMGGQITLDEGALLASFTCPVIVSTDNPGDGCRATGVVALEYCKTGEEDN